METKQRTRKVFVPIQVVEETKIRFDKERGTMTADTFLNQLMD